MILFRILINKVCWNRKIFLCQRKGNDQNLVTFPCKRSRETWESSELLLSLLLLNNSFSFSPSGRPIEIIEKEIQDKIKSNNQPSKITKFRVNVFSPSKIRFKVMIRTLSFTTILLLVDKKEFRRTLPMIKENFLWWKNLKQMITKIMMWT